MSETTQRAKEISSELEAKTLLRWDNARAWAADNSRPLIFGAIAVVMLQWAGIINLGIPSWWPLPVGIAAFAGVAGYFGADKVAEIIPDDDGVLLIALDEQHETGRGIYELSEEEYGNLSVDGTLEPWDESHRRVYECVSYDESSNHAVANWRESAPSSEILSENTVEDALARLKELREDFEPEAAKAREMRRRIRGITRQLDRQRAQEMNTAIDEATVDSDMSDGTIAGVLDQSLPDDLHPHAGGGVDEDTNGHNDGESWKNEPMVELEEIDFEKDPLKQ